MKPVHPRLIPKFCEQCGAPMRDRRPEDKLNQFVCSAPAAHERWIQAPTVAYVIPVDEHDNTYLVRRKIPPAIGGICFAGGYDDFGDTHVETIGHETPEEACIDISGLEAVYLGEWFEAGPGVMVTGLLVRTTSTNLLPFIENDEASERITRSVWSINREELAFNGNWLALEAARRYLRASR